MSKCTNLSLSTSYLVSSILNDHVGQPKYPSNSQGVSLGNSASFAIAINQNGSIFTFVESVKF